MLHLTTPARLRAAHGRTTLRIALRGHLSLWPVNFLVSRSAVYGSQLTLPASALSIQSGSGLHGLDALRKIRNSLIRLRISAASGCHVRCYRQPCPPRISAARTLLRPKVLMPDALTRRRLTAGAATFSDSLKNAGKVLEPSPTPSPCRVPAFL